MDEQEQMLLWSEDIYQFAILLMDVMKQPRDYGNGEILNMVEIHTLSMIAKEPGICISEIARKWNRTLGAASRNVERLVAKGYVTRQKMEGNEKTIHLYVTEHGQRLADQHHRFDLEVIQQFFDLIRGKFSLDDLETFHAVLQTLHEFYKNRSRRQS